MPRIINLKTPTPDDLAELSRLHNIHRRLVYRRNRRKKELFEPIEKLAKVASAQLEIEFDKNIRELGESILKLRDSFRIHTDWDQMYAILRKYQLK